MLFLSKHHLPGPNICIWTWHIKHRTLQKRKIRSKDLGYPTLYKGKLEIPIGKSSGLQHSVQHVGFQRTHKNFLDKKLTPKNSPAEFPSIDCGCLSPFYQHLSFSHLVVYSPTLYVQVHAGNKGKARVSRGTHNFLNISFKIQSTNESHRFSENPHSIVKKNSLLFQKKKYICIEKERAELNHLRKK